MSVMIKTDAGWKKVAGNAKQGGGGGGGTSDYTELSNKPKINNVELTGNKYIRDLGIHTDEIYHDINQGAASPVYMDLQSVIGTIKADIQKINTEVGAANAALEEV